MSPRCIDTGLTAMRSAKNDARGGPRARTAHIPPACGVHLAQNPLLRCALGSEPPAVDVHAQQAVHDLDAAVGSPVHTDAQSNEAAAAEHAGADVILPLLTVPSLVCALLLRTNAHC
jgi:hypothetical protein